MSFFLPKTFFISLLFAVICKTTEAQLQANFSVNKTGGCSPLTVSFNNKTTGASASASYHWDFDNGNQSADANASAVYLDEKTYTVTLTVVDGNVTSTKTQAITVYKKPSAMVATDIVKGCAPLKVTLTATASPGDGTLQSWFWDFGDGETASGGNLGQVQHTYTFAQPASVSFTVQNSYGCQGTVVKDSLIDVLPVLEASFNADETTLCRITDPVHFNNTSKGPGMLSYEWDFGDGAASNTVSPSHRYNSKGNYGVSLTVKSSEGCSATKTIPAYINAANFQSDIISPDLYCTGSETKFISKSTPEARMTEWDVPGYGDGLTYGNATVYYYFNTTGTNQVRMINTFGNCKDTVFKSFVVHASPLLKGFIADKSTECGAPATISFKDTTADAVQWKWNWNCSYNCPTADATISNPVHSFTYPGLQYTRLEVTNADGCSSSVAQTTDLSKPQVLIELAASSTGWRYGCLGMYITFKAREADQIASYKWIFSDDNSTSTEPAPTHIFNTAGVFTVTLNYVLKNGCTGTSVYEDVRARAKPKFDFLSQLGTNICGNTPVKFTGTATENQDWYWFFGDGDFKYFYNGTNNYVEHKYENEGYYTVTVISQIQGCYDTLTKTDYLKINLPIPKIKSYQNTCEGTRGDVVFTDATKGAETWSWTFGDGNSLAYTSPPAEIKHTYQKTGDYMTVLATTNGACTVKDSIVTHVYLKQNPVLSAPLITTCSDKRFDITVNNIENNSQAYYNWAQYSSIGFQYADGRPANLWALSATGYDPGPLMKFSLLQFERGADQFRMIMLSDHYFCYDTTNFIPVNVKGPVAGFSWQPSFCSGNTITFTDTSKSTGNVPIVSREWNFGDGYMATYTTADPVVHQYPYAYSYDVSYKVTDADGCTDQKNIYYLHVGGIKASFTVTAATVSPNTEVGFTNTTFDNYTNSTSFRWIFGDGTTSNDHDARHTYTQPGTYTVLLLATNATYGCTDTARTVIVVKYINSAFSIDQGYLNNSSCPPVLVHFTNKSSNASTVSWDFGDGTRSENVLNPSHLYTRPGQYLVTLHSYSDNGTEYTTTDSVFIRPVISPSVLADKMIACTSGTISFQSPGSRFASYNWDFGDGNVKQSADSFMSYHYSRAGSYTASLVVIDTGGCSSAAKMTEPVIVDSLQIAIGSIPSACNSVQIQFQPIVNSVAENQGRQLYYHWDFGTGNTSDTANNKAASFLYQQPGSYNVQFTVSSPSGCSKQTSRQVIVDQKVKGLIAGPTEVCEGGTAQFSASAAVSAVSWAWNFGQGSTSALQNPGAQNFDRAGHYQVMLTVTNGACTDTSYHDLEVHPLPKITMQHQVLLCYGSSVQLNAGGASSYQWQPSAGLNDATSASPIASPNSTTTYTLQAQSGFGCKATDSVTVTVAPPMNLQVSPDATICSGSQVQLSARGAASYQWIGNTAGLSNPAIANPVAKPVSTTTYAVKATDSYSCFTDTANVTVTVAPLPAVNAGPDLLLTGGNPYTLQPVYSPDITSWYWSPSANLSCNTCATPSVSVVNDMTYVITVKNLFGCASSDTIKITTECGESHVYIPNAFTPNGDSKNSLFKIKGGGVKLVKHLAIYSRWGEVVFEKNNFMLDDASAGWDGNYRGRPVPGGSYVYIASFECASGEVFTKKGTVTVIY